MLPLTPHKVHIVGCLLKAGNYRSTGNYLNIAHQMHTESGEMWTQQLELAGKRFMQSSQRGIGPSRQSRPINFELYIMVRVGEEPLVPGGPVGTENLIVLFTMFLMREIEGAMALRRHIVVDLKGLNVTWHLPVSKNDPAALGCQRSWGCTCITTSVIHRACPFHAALHQKGASVQEVRT